MKKGPVHSSKGHGTLFLFFTKILSFSWAIPLLLDLFYLAFLLLVSPVILYRSIRFGKYRDGFAEKFLGFAPKLPPNPHSVKGRGDARNKGLKGFFSSGEDEKNSDALSDGESSFRRVWFQAVSVGEVNLLKPILARLAEERPNWEVVISSTSKTGYQLAKKRFGDSRTVFYCPLDFSWSVRRALRRIDPDLLVLVELELWPNLILAAKHSGVKIGIVNGRISDESFKNYRLVRRFTRSLLQKIDLIAASDDRAADYFRRLGAEEKGDDGWNLVVTGSIKFDGVRIDRNNPKTVELATLAGIPIPPPLDLDPSIPDTGSENEEGTTDSTLRSAQNPEPNIEVVFLAGSTQEPEEAMALETFRSLAEEFPQLTLILVPRHPERFGEVAHLLDRSGLAWVRRTTMTPDFRNRSPERSRVFLIDTVGELGAWWGVASIAFVGGSMGSRGGQNMLEPAGYGAAVAFGPNTRNFREISDRMIRSDAAVVIHDQEEMTRFVRQTLTDPVRRNQLGRNAQQLVLSQKGACAKTVSLLTELVEADVAPTP